MDGRPAIDAAGEWIYLLRRRGLWVLREEDLFLQSIFPFAGMPPQDLQLAPDGQTLYLFGNGWLTALSTAKLQSQGLVPVSPLPTAWFTSKPSEEYVQPRVYPSPQMDEDGVAFVQLVGQAGNFVQTYHTTDGGRSWHPLRSLVDPDLAGVRLHSLSPDFTNDKTLSAVSGWSTLLRSTDGGMTWEAWQSRIAFASDRDGNREIYTMDLEGNDVQRLTDSPAAEENPAWSPDGRAIAFVSTRDGNPEIYVMDSNGQNQRRLTFHPTGDWRPAWLPDSTHLVFVSYRSGNNDIYQLTVHPPDAAPLASVPELTPVVVSPADDRDPATRLGGELLFLSDRDGIMRAYTLKIGDRYAQPFALTETDQPEAHPATLPGEAYTILVSSERDGPSTIYRVNLSEYTPLAPSPAFDGHPAAGPTGWDPDPAASLAWLQEHAH